MAMADDTMPSRPPYGKTRSASISAPASTSLETIISPPSENGTPENGTPNYRRRRPATRSQSARITGARSVRKKPQVQQQNFHEMKSHFTSEPRLSETETPPIQRRKGSQRRPTTNSNASPYTSGRRKSNICTYLDVPSANFHAGSDEDDDTVIRTFSSSKQGVINRGDSFRRRRSRSHSANPPASSPMRQPEQVLPTNTGPTDSFFVGMLGAPGVGKAALVSQFRTSECINAYDDGDEPNEQNISIILDGVESELKFRCDNKGSKELMEGCDAFLIIYSVVDKSSFSRAEQFLIQLQEMEMLRPRACILVANKIDLARSRAVSAQDGRCLACTYRVKFVEVSVGINHNVDELLAGTLTQIRLKREHAELQGNKEGSGHWYKNRNVVRASMKARQMITWIFGKEDSKFKNCENLLVL